MVFYSINHQQFLRKETIKMLKQNINDKDYDNHE